MSVAFAVVRLGPQGDSRLPYADGEFDVVLCNSVLHHLDEPLGTLDELARVANPAGAVLVRDLLRPPAPRLDCTCACSDGTTPARCAGCMRRRCTRRTRSQSCGRCSDGSRLNDGRSRVFQRGLTHLGIERPALARTGV